MLFNVEFDIIINMTYIWYELNIFRRYIGGANVFPNYEIV